MRRSRSNLERSVGNDSPFHGDHFSRIVEGRQKRCDVDLREMKTIEGHDGAHFQGAGYFARLVEPQGGWASVPRLRESVYFKLQSRFRSHN